MSPDFKKLFSAGESSLADIRKKFFTGESSQVFSAPLRFKLSRDSLTQMDRKKSCLKFLQNQARTLKRQLVCSLLETGACVRCKGRHLVNI